MHPDPIPRFRLLRDVLRLDPADAAYQGAEENIKKSKWVCLLQNTQQADGTWGRFHTRDTRLKQPFPTTEIAITIALDTGLDKNDPIVHKALGRILDYVDGKTSWPDPAEKHDNPLAWLVWVQHFSAAVVAQIDQYHPSLGKFWSLWAEALKAAFHSETYDRKREIEALNTLLKCRMKDPVPFHKKYPLLILSATDQRLPERLERMLLSFVMNSPTGIYYVYDRKISLLPAIHSKGFWSWVRAQKMLSRFRLWRELSEDAVNWIWDQRTKEGFWDSGSKTARMPYSSFPLSESWRRPENRIIDCSVELLTLLSKCFELDLDQSVTSLLESVTVT